MKKFVSIIASAAITGSIAMAGAMSSFAAEDTAPETTTQASTEVTTEVSTEATTVASTEETIVTSAETTAVTTAETTTQTAAETSASAQEFTATDAAEKVFDALTKAGESREDFNVTNSVYDSENDFWTITIRRVNGNDIRIYKATADGAVRIDINTDATTTASASTTVAQAQATTTTKAATTTAAKTTANKNSSPKTGVAFPALPAAGIAVAVVAVAFTLKKKEN